MSIHPSLRARKILKKGFTLIEILVSVVVIAIGCLAAIAMQSSTMESGVQAYSLTVASFLAESEIERLKSLRRSTVEGFKAGQLTAHLTRDGETCTQNQPHCYTRTVTVEPGYPTSNSVGLTVRVSFPGRGSPVVYETFLTYLDFTK